MFIVIDSIIVLSAIVASHYLVLASFNVFTISVIAFAAIILISHYLFSFYFKFYKKVWEYASIGELWTILKVATLAIISALMVDAIWFEPMSHRLMVATGLMYMVFLGGSRFLWRIFRDRIIPQTSDGKRTLIVGAGSAGTMVARQLLREQSQGLSPVAFIDDDFGKQQLDILSLPVAGGVKDIPNVVENFEIDHIIIAIPSLDRRDLNTIFKECAKTEAQTKILPAIEDLITGKVAFSQFRDVRVEDLLGRDPVEMDMTSIAKHITGKVVLITGGGGSIGSEIARQITMFRPEQLILLGHGENSIYQIEMELKHTCKHTEIEFVTEIAEIQDARKMEEVMSRHQPDVVYHAAAHKHVPLMERSPDEAVKNNMIGTMNVAKAAAREQVKTFVMVSTDKAVNPTSVMGASKRLAEMIIQDMGRGSRTKFVAVRFGNVLGSRGSVIPLFKRQIENGGPITITHPDMVRYFMTIPEASRLVIQAGALAKGGEIFVLDMGKPVKILDLATNLIKLSGFTLNDISIEFTGIRPGEKLFEELLNDGESHEEQIHPKIYIGKTTSLYMEEIEHIIHHYHIYSRNELRDELLQLANQTIPNEAQQAMPM
nr:nucleoside-diphosphate sugar epimerase/dehydratase [Lentibacillus sp. JNUCC-1]